MKNRSASGSPRMAARVRKASSFRLHQRSGRAAQRRAVSFNRWCSLKEEAFRTLAAMRGDPDAERFFIDYFVELDPYSGHPALTDIANSFWN